MVEFQNLNTLRGLCNSLPPEYEWNIFCFFHFDSKFRWGHTTIDICAWNDREGEKNKNERKEFGLCLFFFVPCVVCYFDKWITYIRRHVWRCIYIRITEIVAVTLFGVGSCCCSRSTTTTENATDVAHRWFCVLLNAPASFEFSWAFSQHISVHGRWDMTKEKWFGGSHKCTKPEAKSHTPKKTEKTSKLFDDTQSLIGIDTFAGEASSGQVCQGAESALKWIIASLAV